MNPTTRLKKQTVIFTLSLLHFIAGLYLYTDHIVLSVLGFFLVLLNVGYLLHHFSFTLRFMLLYRTKKPLEHIPQAIGLIVVGIIGQAALSYGFFLLIYRLIVQIILLMQ